LIQIARLSRFSFATEFLLSNFIKLAAEKKHTGLLGWLHTVSSIEQQLLADCAESGRE
jgi:hypothetical protein